MSLMTLWMVWTCLEGAMFKIWLKSDELKRIRNPLKIVDISRVLAGVDDEIYFLDLGWCPWRHYGWCAHALRGLCLKFGWYLLSLKASRTLSKMADIAGDLEDAGCSWLGLMSSMTFWMVFTCPEGAWFKIWLKSVKFEGIKNPLKDQWPF